MFLRSKAAQQCRLFSQQLSNTLQNNKRLIENTAIITTAAVAAYHYNHLVEKTVQSHVALFKSNLTVEQIKEIETSPEKDEAFRKECKQELAMMLRLD